MCGIVGYIGAKDAQPILLEGLSRLEYRGYDSAGIATLFNEHEQNFTTTIRRSVGKIAKLQGMVEKKPCKGHIGIGHTRWATHGKPTELNAHPHHTEGITVVHNGIIENYRELKSELLKKGHRFTSDTDTEVVAHAIAEQRQNHSTLKGAVFATLKKIRGAYALVILDENESDKIVCAAHYAPLVIGLGHGEMFVASDFAAVLAHTQRFFILHDGDVAVVQKNGATFFNAKGQTVERPIKTIDWSVSAAEKGGFKHFMLKEIYDQPTAIADTFRERINQKTNLVKLDDVDTKKLKKAKRIIIVACGSSYHAGLLAKYYIETLARIPVEVDLASEFRYRAPILNSHTLVIGISQSGETADTLTALQQSHREKAVVLGICNVIDSSIARLCNRNAGALYTRAGPEISVASTKAFLTQTVALYLLALHLATERKTQSQKNVAKHIEQLRMLPRLAEGLLKQNDAIRQMAMHYERVNHMLYLGRNLFFPIALEGALKMKEISYIHAEGYPAGEMKHGPIALIDETMPVIVIAPKTEHYDKIASNIEEVSVRGGRLFGIISEQDTNLMERCEAYFCLPHSDEYLLPILATIPLQLLAYYTADIRGTDVDQPRNLAKSVTVE